MRARLPSTLLSSTSSPSVAFSTEVCLWSAARRGAAALTGLSPSSPVGGYRAVWDCPLEIKIVPGLCELYSANPYDFLDGAIPLSFAGWFVTTDNKVRRRPCLPRR